MTLRPVDEKIRRSAVVSVNLDPTVGHEIQKTRPCIVLSPDTYNVHLRTVLVVPVTSVKAGSAAGQHEVALTAGSGGLSVDSIAQPHQMRCIDKKRIVAYLGRLSPECMARVQQAAEMAIGALSTDR